MTPARPVLPVMGEVTGAVTVGVCVGDLSTFPRSVAIRPG